MNFDLELIRTIQRHLTEENLVAAKPLLDAMSAAADSSTNGGLKMAHLLLRSQYLQLQREFTAARALLGDGLRQAGSHPLLRGQVLGQFAALDMREGRFAEAEEVLRECLSLAERAGDHGALADAAFNLATIITQREESETGIPLWEQALAGYRKVGRSHQVGDCLHHLGVAYRILGDDAKAVAYLRESIEFAMAADDPAGVERRAGDLARTHYCMHDDGVSGALALGREAVEVMMAANARMWSRATAAELSLGARVTRAVNSFNNIETAMLVALASDDYEECFAHSALAKGRILRGDHGGRSNAEVERFRATHPGFSAQSTEELAVNASFLLLGALAPRTGAGSSPVSFVDAFATTGDQLVLTAHIRDGDPETIQDRLPWPAGAGPSVDARRMFGESQGIRARAAAEHVLAAMERYSGRAAYMFDASTGHADEGQRATMVRDAAELAESLRALGSWHFPDELVALFRERAVRHVYLSPDPRIFSLPWGALILGDGSSVADQPWTLSVVPSILSLYDIERRRRTEGKNEVRFLAPRQDAMVNLGGDAELAALQRLFDVKVAREDEATNATLGVALGEGGWVHLRTHGTSDREAWVPAMSDGPWRPDLSATTSEHSVFISVACRSGETSARGQDVMGMFDLCERLDLRATLAPVTSVDGDAARFFMERFYEALAAGLTIAESQRQAMIRTRDQLPHPAFWAAFLLAGDPDVRLITNPNSLASAATRPG